MYFIAIFSPKCCNKLRALPQTQSMKTLYIQYRIVKELRQRNLQRDYPERNPFFSSLSQYTFARRISADDLYLALDDIIGSDPREHYIDYHEDHEGTKERKRLAVTRKGRKFIRSFPFGFLEELAREYPFMLTVLAAAAVGWVLNVVYQAVVTTF